MTIAGRSARRSARRARWLMLTTRCCGGACCGATTVAALRRSRSRDASTASRSGPPGGGRNAWRATVPRCNALGTSPSARWTLPLGGCRRCRTFSRFSSRTTAPLDPMTKAKVMRNRLLRMPASARSRIQQASSTWLTSFPRQRGSNCYHSIRHWCSTVLKFRACLTVGFLRDGLRVTQVLGVVLVCGSCGRSKSSCCSTMMCRSTTFFRASCRRRCDGFPRR
mmetsp:Transcript_52932/g.162939  ORF Transcript_52932/g.162939 Transcript_52932/m.162939 type:complete len:223 (+) Transcript_52932:924-1592(+)